MIQLLSTIHPLRTDRWTHRQWTTDRPQWYHRCLQHSCKCVKKLCAV